MFDTVLFPIDQSRQTMDTAAVALKLALQHGSRWCCSRWWSPKRA
jgi:hypothetical protein